MPALPGPHATTYGVLHQRPRGTKNRGEEAGRRGADAVQVRHRPGKGAVRPRMGTVEPVFGNLQNKGMRRFTLRGRRKVNTQWQLFTMVHNIEKIASSARTS
ncbi:MAG TPA: transposase [Polyangiaceae bacterium]|nr:transposase [Polyangiaceae bacterium]